MDLREYLRVVQVGTSKEVIMALRDVTDFHITFLDLDRKIQARSKTKFATPSQKKPKFRFSQKFYAKLSKMPAVSIEVRESRSHIRKTCYGFRCKRTGERVYFRVDPGSLVEFRDSPCGYLIGTRYLIPGIDRMKDPRWDKVNRLVTRLLSREGIIVNRSDVRKYWSSTRARCKLAKRLVDLRIVYLKWQKGAGRAKTIK